MATKITDTIYKQIVPLPNNPLREINAYLIVGEKNPVLRRFNSWNDYAEYLH